MNRFWLKGMTTLELMIVVAIIAALLGAATLALPNLKADWDLTSATNQLYADLEWARQKSIGGAHLYGLHFQPNDVVGEGDMYIVFEDRNDNGQFDADQDPPEEIATRYPKGLIRLDGYPEAGDVIFSRKGTSQMFTITLIHPRFVDNLDNPTAGFVREIRVSMFNSRVIGKIRIEESEEGGEGEEGEE